MSNSVLFRQRAEDAEHGREHTLGTIVFCPEAGMISSCSSLRRLGIVCDRTLRASLDDTDEDGRSTRDGELWTLDGMSE